MGAQPLENSKAMLKMSPRNGQSTWFYPPRLADHGPGMEKADVSLAGVEGSAATAM